MYTVHDFSHAITDCVTWATKIETHSLEVCLFCNSIVYDSNKKIMLVISSGKIYRSLSFLVMCFNYIDECSNNTSMCGVNSTCVNALGSYLCVCDEGYTYYRNECIVQLHMYCMYRMMLPRIVSSVCALGFNVFFCSMYISSWSTELYPLPHKCKRKCTLRRDKRSEGPNV